MMCARTLRLVSIAVVFAFVLVLAGAPGAAGAAPAFDRRGLARPGASPVSASAVADDDIPGVDATLPLAVDGTLDATAYAPVDGDDVFRVYLLKDQYLVATLTIDTDAYAGVSLFDDAADDVWDYTVADSAATDVDNEQVLTFVVPADGYYYLDVWAMPKMDPDPADEFPGYDGWGGPYSLAAEVGDILATSITIKTAATTTYIGRTVTLSGAVTPLKMIGVNIVVYVKKPGRAYWTYSSNRTVYNAGGKAAWLYKYYFKPGMVKGYYTYKAVVPAWPGFLTSTSPTTVSIRLR